MKRFLWVGFSLFYFFSEIWIALDLLIRFPHNERKFRPKEFRFPFQWLSNWGAGRLLNVCLSIYTPLGCHKHWQIKWREHQTWIANLWTNHFGNECREPPPPSLQRYFSTADRTFLTSEIFFYHLFRTL